MNLKIIALASAAVAAMGLTAGSVQSAVTFTSYGVAVPANETLLTDFSSASYLSGTGYTLRTGSGSFGAAPAFSHTTRDPNQYLAVVGGTGATVTLPTDTDVVSLYIGSLDAFNTVTFNFTNGPSQTFMGSQLGAISGVPVGGYGNQLASTTNGRFVFTFGALDVSSIEFKSVSTAFELADIGVGGVPEPGTWALMIAGVAMMGAGLRYARRQGVATQTV